MILIRQIGDTWVLSWPDGGWIGAFPSCQAALDRVCSYIVCTGRSAAVQIGELR